MSADLTRDVVRRFFGTALNHGNMNVGRALLAPGYLDHHGFLGQIPDAGGFEGLARALRDGFPDAYYVLDDILVDGAKAVVRVTFQGTHMGTFRGIQPTGRKVTVGGVHVFRLTGGLIAEHWAYENVWGLLTGGSYGPPMQARGGRHLDLAGAIW